MYTGPNRNNPLHIPRPKPFKRPIRPNQPAFADSRTSFPPLQNPNPNKLLSLSIKAAYNLTPQKPFVGHSSRGEREEKRNYGFVEATEAARR